MPTLLEKAESHDSSIQEPTTSATVDDQQYCLRHFISLNFGFMSKGCKKYSLITQMEVSL